MKLGIISDVHGNYPALCAVMEELRKAKCSEILCLGDVSGYYSMVNECMDLLRRENVVCLKGNHDSYLLGEGECPRSNSVNRCIAYQKSILSAENLRWLATLQPALETRDFSAVHGGWTDPVDEYIGQFDFSHAREHMPGVKLFLSGHTHIQTLQKEGDMVYCNPGSVGQPRDHDPRAAYAILDGTELTIHRVQYDIDAIAAHMEQAGFTDYYYRNLYHGKKIGEQ